AADDRVGEASEVAGSSPENYADQQRDRGGDERDLERDLAAREHAEQQVPAERAVGPEHEERVAVADAEGVVRHPCPHADRVGGDPVHGVLERGVGAVTENSYEDRLEHEAREHDEDQPVERGDRQALTPEPPPDERAVTDRSLECRAAPIEPRRRVSQTIRHGPILIGRSTQDYSRLSISPAL